MTAHQSESEPIDSPEQILQQLANEVEWCVVPELLSGAAINRKREDNAISDALAALDKYYAEEREKAVVEAKTEELVHLLRNSTQSGLYATYYEKRIAELKGQQQ